MFISYRFLQTSTALAFVLSASLFSTASAVPVIGDPPDREFRKSPNPFEGASGTDKGEVETHPSTNKPKVEDCPLDLPMLVPPPSPSKDPDLIEDSSTKPPSSKNETPTKAEDETLPPILSLFQNVPEMRNEILSYLHPQDLQALNLTASQMHREINAYLVMTDKRGLAYKVWKEGPEKGSFENYRFNAMLWHIQCQMISMYYEEGVTLKKEGRLHKPAHVYVPMVLRMIESLQKDIAYLEKVFQSYLATEKIVDLLRRSCSRILHLGGKAEEEIEFPKNQQQPEQELYDLLSFLTRYNNFFSCSFERDIKQIVRGDKKREQSIVGRMRACNDLKHKIETY